MVGWYFHIEITITVVINELSYRRLQLVAQHIILVTLSVTIVLYSLYYNILVNEFVYDRLINLGNNFG